MRGGRAQRAAGLTARPAPAAHRARSRVLVAALTALASTLWILLGPAAGAEAGPPASPAANVAPASGTSGLAAQPAGAMRVPAGSAAGRPGRSTAPGSAGRRNAPGATGAAADGRARPVVRSWWPQARPALPGTMPGEPARVLRGDQAEFGMARDHGGADGWLRMAALAVQQPASHRTPAAGGPPPAAPPRSAPARDPPLPA